MNLNEHPKRAEFMKIAWEAIGMSHWDMVLLMEKVYNQGRIDALKLIHDVKVKDTDKCCK